MKRSDHWVWLRNTFAVTALVVLIGLAAAPRVVRAACTGDCGNISKVTVTNIVTMVDIALGTAQLSECTNGDESGDGHITVDEILKAVNNALNNGCGVIPGCGNGAVDADEDCDDGGTCIGGSNAGTHCTAESDCIGNGVCKEGSKAETACDPTNPDACPGSSCQKCIPQGGDGCAANCTTETTVDMPLEPGVILDPTKIKAGTSGSTVWNAVLGPLALQMVGGQTLVVGKVGKDNKIPVIVNASNIHEIDVAQLSCACVRGVADKTCGGVLFEADGTTLATDCTPFYIMGTCDDSPQKPCTTANETTVCDSQVCVGGICGDCHTDDECSGTCVVHACDGKNPCTFVHGQGGTCSVTTTKTCRQKSDCPGDETCVLGPGGLCSVTTTTYCTRDSGCPPGETCVLRGGNLSSGVISCVPGLKGTNQLMTEDSKRADGLEDPPQCDYTSDAFVIGSTFPDCAQPPVVTLSDQNPAPVGAALVINSTAIGQFTGPCTDNPEHRPDNFCTDEESYTHSGGGRGQPNTLPAVTGTASAQMTNIFLGGSTTDLSVCKCANDTSTNPVWSCPVVTPCEAGGNCCSGPQSIPGSPLPRCAQLLENPPNVSGLGLAGAFTSPAGASISDTVITDLLQAH